MREAKIVIGANFGDEGKGQMTEYLAWQAKKKGTVLVVKHNGGAQAGHTVIHNGERFIFHHFGSGSTLNVPTYLTEDFILNPILFQKEYEELEARGITPTVFVNKNAAFTTPYEMIINQTIEEARGKVKHGSCGVGIFETVKRNRKVPMKIKDVKYTTDVKALFDKISDEYLHERMMELGIYEMEDWIREDVNKMMKSYIANMIFMFSHIYLVDSDLIETFDSVIFETAQGLMLDQNNMEYFPHLTPSNTGSTNPAKYLSGYDVEKELIYVTRTYLTRHGAGMFKTECKKEDINSDMFDETNVPNKYQDTLRYGYMQLSEFYTRIVKDSRNIPDAKVSIAVTHMNETDGCFCLPGKKVEVTCFPWITYTSDGMTKESIIKTSD